MNLIGLLLGKTNKLKKTSKKNRQTNYLEDFNRFPKSQKDKTLGDVIQNYWTCKELGKNLLKFQEKHSQEMPTSKRQRSYNYLKSILNPLT